MGRPRPTGDIDRPRPEQGVLEAEAAAPLVRPAIGLAPQTVQDGQLVLQQVGARDRSAGSRGPAGDARSRSSRRRRRPRLRPPLISSTVVTTLARTPGWRKVTGETRTPSPIRWVSRARPASTVQASVVGRPGGPGKLAKWSDRKNAVEPVGLGSLGRIELVGVASSPAGARASARTASSDSPVLAGPSG